MEKEIIYFKKILKSDKRIKIDKHLDKLLNK